MGASVDKIEVKDINFHEQIGEGGFGTVKRVTFKKSYKGYRKAAAKTVLSELCDREVIVMSQLQHPNIVALIGICQTEVANLILMEYAPNGSLHDYLKDPQNPLPSRLQRKWAMFSARALQYLHQQNYLHRDIKPQNCLLFEDNVLKLCDFGLAREIEASQTTSSQKGTYRYMAPEIHVGNECGRGIYSKPSDIWSYGMLLLEICTRKPPFEDLEWHRVVFEVGGGAKPTISENCPKDLSNIMQRCWESDPKQRISIDDIVIALNAMEIHPEHEGRPLAVSQVACCPNGDIVVVDKMSQYAAAPKMDASAVWLCSSDGKSKGLLMRNTDTSHNSYFRRACVSPLGYILIIYVKYEHVHGRGYVNAFNLKGEYLHDFSLFQREHQLDFECYTIDKQGNLLVCRQPSESERMLITVFRCPDGALIRRIQWSHWSFGFIQGVSVNSKYQILIISHQYDSNHRKIVTIDYRVGYSGIVVYSFTPRIDENVTGVQCRSGDIVCDEKDNIYVAMKLSGKAYTGHVHAYSPTGKFLQCMTSSLFEPSDLSMTPDGKLFVANFQTIVVLNPH